MYKYRHTGTQEIIEIADIIVDNMGDYFDSPYVESWWHIDDATGEIDNYSDTYVANNGDKYM